jgi:PAS domain S-box-containing protein
VARDGRVIAVQLHMIPVEAPEREGTFCKAAVSDITARKQAEDLLQQERNLLRTLIDNLPDYVYVKDAQGRFIAANLAAARIMGARTPGDLIGKTDADFYPAELADEYRQDEQRLAGTGEPLVNKEEPHVDTAGNRRAVLTTKVPLKDSQGRFVGLVGVSRDVTDRKRIEEELRLLNRTLEERVAQRTEEAQRRTAERQALACELIQTEDRQRRRLAQVLHDNLQQLLVAARMKVGRLGKRAADQTLREELRNVEQILAESISESRSLTLELSPPVLNEAGLAGGLQWLAEEMENKHGLCVGVEIDPAAEPGDEASRVFLFQAVRELLFNVVKHAQAASAKVRLTRGEGATIRVDVGDDGVGVDPVRQAWGFGLASVHQRLEGLGGRMEMEAAPGGGTEISIFVPQRPAAPASATRPRR